MYLEQTNLLINNTYSHHQLLADYKTICLSRNLSILGRKEVHNGRAHFGIFGDGKELVQAVMARFFKRATGVQVTIAIRP